jgi:uncharacterized membrane protein
VNITPQDIELLKKMRQEKPAHKMSHDIKWGDKIADKVTKIVGSWRFLIIQSTLLLLWLVLNITGYIYKWDPYPFILLNLVLSFQAAYTAPVIMMSQNRQAEIDRKKLEYYYKINIKEELEIRLLHDKLNLLLKHHGLENVHDVTEK